MATAMPRSLRSLTVALALLVAACGTVAPTGQPATAGPASGPPASAPPASAPPASAGPTQAARPAGEVYAEIRTAVQGIRGLEPTKAVEPVTIDVEQLETNYVAAYDRENSPAELQLAEDFLITLGLLPAGSDLRTIMLDFQTGQIAGYYSPEEDQLFVVSRSGALGPLEESTYAHEFTHQLQDQHMNLDGLGLDADDQSDRALASLALVEGDAVTVQVTWMLANLAPEQLGELIKSSLDPKAMEALTRAPEYIRETALFPYQEGQGFVTALLGDDGYASVNAAYAASPASTEQVMHFEKYTDREAPVVVAVPGGVAATLGTGWSEAAQDTLGELILGLWLRINGVPRTEATAAAAGWGGDRAVMLRGPDGAIGIGLITTWDSAADAEEFSAAATTAVKTLGGESSVVYDGLLRVYVTVGDRSADILGALTD